MKKTKHKKEFTEELSDACKYLINKHKSEPEEVEARNELFMLLKDWMDIWIRSILCNWHRTERQETILALSWDIFCFALKHYKKEFTIPGHFFYYTRYYLLNRYAQKDSVHISLEELKDVLALVPSAYHDKFEKLLTLFQLTQVIPKEYKIAWDDALQSLHSAPQYKQQTKGPKGVETNTYKHLKKSFIPIIKFILKE